MDLDTRVHKGEKYLSGSAEETKYSPRVDLDPIGPEESLQLITSKTSTRYSSMV